MVKDWYRLLQVRQKVTYLNMQQWVEADNVQRTKWLVTPCVKFDAATNTVLRWVGRFQANGLKVNERVMLAVWKDLVKEQGVKE